MKRSLTIYGCGGHARSVADIVLANGSYDTIVFVDENARDRETLYGFDVLRSPAGENTPCFPAIGDNAKRKAKLEAIGEELLVSIISRTAHIGLGAKLGNGVFVGNYCHIGPEALIGKNTIINHGAVVEHEVAIGEHCHIGPRATVCGRCRVGDLVLLGAGATVKDYVTICPNVVIGAGATVVSDIRLPGVYVGTPAKRMR